MGTTQKTSQAGVYDPGSMQLFQNLSQSLGPMLQSYMQNPFGNPFFQTQQQLGTKQAQNLGGTQMSNVARNLTASGLGGGGSTSPFAMEMLQNQGRANTGLQANLGFLSPVQNALGMQQWAGNLGAAYRPLQTGQNQTQSTSGLGTWLPQVAGMGLSALMGMPGMGGSGGLFGSANNYASGGLTSGAINNPGQGAFGEGGAGMPWAGAPSGMGGFGGGMSGFPGQMPSMPGGMPGFGSGAPGLGMAPAPPPMP